ncbi:MAG TPA: hypothetical protein VEX39_10365 [Thermoleophilaceae bacterium]|nr:hypothetical protein [Thermoleophilaceae bacterium]
MTHPLQRWPVHHRRPALIALCVATLVITVVGGVAQPLGDRDIVDFELAGSVGEAKEILAGWRAEGVIGEAKAIQLFDLVFPLIYASALAGCCLAAAGVWRRRGRPRAAALGVAMAWLALAAAGFDYVENVGLAVSLWHEPVSPWPGLALVAAVLKFAAIYLTLAYALSGALASIRR